MSAMRLFADGSGDGIVPSRIHARFSARHRDRAIELLPSTKIFSMKNVSIDAHSNIHTQGHTAEKIFLNGKGTGLFMYIIHCLSIH